MHKLLKGFLIAAGVLLALALVAVLAVNLYVQSAGTQRRIEKALSSAIKAPVQVTNMSVTPWGGFRASGVTIPQTAPMHGNFLEAAGFTARFDWGALASHKLDARKMTIEQPVVEWFQTANGRWEMPRLAPVALPSPGVSPAPRAVPRASPAPAGKPWQLTVHQLLVKGAAFDFWDNRDTRVMQYSGVQFSSFDPKLAGATGTASAQNISLHDRVFFHDMRTNWNYAPGSVKLSAFQAGVAGGQLRGDVEVKTTQKRSPFDMDASFDGVKLDKLMADAGEPADQVFGTAKGWIDLNGNTSKTSSLNGSGELELAGGKMQNIEILQMLGRGLQIPDLVQLDLKKGEVDLRVVSGVVYVDKLLMQSQNLEVSGTGTVEIGGRMSLNARLTVDPMVSQKMRSFILANFKPGEVQGSYYIDFVVNNTLNHPKTDLLENILGHRVQNEMTDLIRKIFVKSNKKVEPEAPAP